MGSVPPPVLSATACTGCPVAVAVPGDADCEAVAVCVDDQLREGDSDGDALGVAAAEDEPVALAVPDRVPEPLPVRVNDGVALGVGAPLPVRLCVTVGDSVSDGLPVPLRVCVGVREVVAEGVCVALGVAPCVGVGDGVGAQAVLAAVRRTAPNAAVVDHAPPCAASVTARTAPKPGAGTCRGAPPSLGACHRTLALGCRTIANAAAEPPAAGGLTTNEAGSASWR